MKVIRFHRLNGSLDCFLDGRKIIEVWEIAFSEEHLHAKLGDDLAEVIMPARPWYVRAWRRLFPPQPLNGTA